MPSAIETIKLGITSGSWDLVSEGFQSLTGEYVVKQEPSKKKPGRKPKNQLPVEVVPRQIAPDVTKIRGKSSNKIVIDEEDDGHQEQKEAITQRVERNKVPQFVGE